MTTACKTWLVGDSWLHWLQKYTKKRNISENLNCANIQATWYSKRGMRWEEVYIQIRNRINLEKPDIIIIHCGGNDLGETRSITLITKMKSDLLLIMHMLPHTRIVFSHITQRQIWKFGRIRGSILEKSRKRINKVISAFLKDHNMHSIPHPNINHDNVLLFYKDGVHLSTTGNAIFLRNLQAYLTY